MRRVDEARALRGPSTRTKCQIWDPMHVLDEDNVLGPNHFQQASVEPHTDVDCDRYQEIRQCMPWKVALNETLSE